MLSYFKMNIFGSLCDMNYEICKYADVKENALFRGLFFVGSFKLLGIDLIYIIISQ